MIGSVGRAFDNIFGRGEAAVTIPPLDGALRPNRVLDETTLRFPLADVDSLVVLGGQLVAGAGNIIYAFDPGGSWYRRSDHEAEIAALATIGDDGLAIALATGEIVVQGGRFSGRRYGASKELGCVTELTIFGNELFVANGSATNGARDWQRDLLERNASGSIWRIDLESGASTRITTALAWPAGLVVERGAIVFSESWKHRLVRSDLAKPGRMEPVHTDLPGYPGRLALAGDGYWLALFAPRSQLVEFVLREPGYRKRMMAEVPEPFWVSPKLRSGRSFYESLQGGGVKHLGMLKPWAPTMSAGLLARLDRAFQPRFSLQSRADGRTHGVTAAVEHNGQVFVVARGGDVVVSLPVADLGGAA